MQTSKETIVEFASELLVSNYCREFSLLNHFSSLNYLIHYKQEFHGDINALSDDYKDVIPDADVIFLCMPVHQYRNALKKLAPFINRSKKEVFIGTIYGQAGFNWMVSLTVSFQFLFSVYVVV